MGYSVVRIEAMDDLTSRIGVGLRNQRHDVRNGLVLALIGPGKVFPNLDEADIQQAVYYHAAELTLNR